MFTAASDHRIPVDHAAANRPACVARWAVQERALRRRKFARLLPTVCEPVWAMLLDLYIAREDGREVSTTSLCLAADVPVSTALRYLVELSGLGLIERRPHATDGRRLMVGLSPELYEQMRSHFESLMLQRWPER